MNEKVNEKDISKDFRKVLFELLKTRFFTGAIEKMGEKNQDELLKQILSKYSENLPNFSINNLTIHIPELINYAVALGIRYGVDFKNFEMAVRRIQEEINKKKSESFYI